jgi:hypothetical protein
MSAPAKVVQVVLPLAERATPAHLLLGSDAVQIARPVEKNGNRRQGMAQHQRLNRRGGCKRFARFEVLKLALWTQSQSSSLPGYRKFIEEYVDWYCRPRYSSIIRAWPRGMASKDPFQNTCSNPSERMRSSSCTGASTGTRCAHRLFSC